MAVGVGSGMDRVGNVGADRGSSGEDAHRAIMRDLPGSAKMPAAGLPVRCAGSGGLSGELEGADA